MYTIPALPVLGPHGWMDEGTAWWCSAPQAWCTQVVQQGQTSPVIQKDREQVSRTGLVTHRLPPRPSQEQAELKLRGRELKAREEQLTRDRELLDEAWHELRLEKEKVKGAALRIRQREEEIKSMNKVSGVPELLSQHTGWQQSQGITPLLRPCILLLSWEGNEGMPKARSPVPILCSLQLSSQKYEEGEQALREACRLESEHQTRLQLMQQHLEQLKQQEQQLQQVTPHHLPVSDWGCHPQGLNLVTDLSPFLLGLGQERLSMAHQRRQLEQLREELPSNPTLLLPTHQDLGVPTKGLSGVLSKADRRGGCAFISHLGSLGVLLGAV